MSRIRYIILHGSSMPKKNNTVIETLIERPKPWLKIPVKDTHIQKEHIGSALAPRPE